MMDFLRQLREVNTSRAEHWHRQGLEPWLGVDWSNAMGGECGEAQNVVKKIRRIDTRVDKSLNVVTKEELIIKLGNEIADVIIYADLLAKYYGLDLQTVITDKFNEISIRENLPERLT